MNRIPEPELMDEPDQARAYAEADFSEPNSLFLDLYREAFPDSLAGCMLDLGCGPADIPLGFARIYPELHFHALDGAEAMLAHARRVWSEAGLDDRVEFVHGRLPQVRLPQAQYDSVICNSLLHHLPDPRVLWSAVAGYARPGAPVLVMDLCRPENAGRARELVAAYAGDAPPVLRRDFENSLYAAYTVDEVREQLLGVGMDFLSVRMVSDRHWMVAGRYRASG